MKWIRYRKTAVIFTAFVMLLCAGCTSQKASRGSYRVVTQIDVHYYQEPLISHDSFTEPEKMQKLLYYLRKISPYGTPKDDPEKVKGTDYYITLTYSDQTKKTYQQRDNRFMRVNGGPWKRIDPEQALMLSQILGTMNSDVSDA